MNPLKICIAASEVVPFAKTGGLADVSGALGKFLGNQGHDVRIFMPFYNMIRPSGSAFHMVDYAKNIPIHFPDRTLYFSLISTKLPDSNTDVYFIHCPALYHRGSVYTGDWDEYLRFAFLCRAILKSCQIMGWAPNIIHTHDWHTGMIALYLKTLYKWDRLFQHTKTMLTIHNIGYQGVFGSEVIEKIGLSEYSNFFDYDDLRRGIVNYLKTGILYADVLTAVSSTYAKEIMTSESGAGLNYFVRMRSNRLLGIVNGVDYDEWNPETDKFLPHHYSIHDLSGKEKNKKDLLEQLGLPYDPKAPVFGIVSRLVHQKGFEILMEILFDFLRHNNVRFLILGSGDHKYENFFTTAQHYFPHQVCYYQGYNNELAHLIEASSDVFVMPSRYEPCGLNQIYSLKYGTVPIVRKTGGLADTVQLWDPHSGSGTGFVFEHFTGDALRWAFQYALDTFGNPESWKRLVYNGMSRNYSWNIQGQKYLELYSFLLHE